MNNPNLKTYTIQEVSKLINVPARTIKKWETDFKEILIIPRTKQGARLYTEIEVSFFKKVKGLREKNTSKEKMIGILKTQAEEESKTIPEAIPETISETIQEDISEDFETALIPVSPPTQMQERRETPNLEDFFNLMDVYKQNLLEEVKSEIRNGIRNEVVEEVKKEISKGSLQTVKSLSKSIHRLRNNNKSEFNDLSNKITEATEVNYETFNNLSTTIELTSQNTFKTFEMLSNNISESSEVTAEEITTLSNRIIESSHATADEMKKIIQEISNTQDNTNQEISNLVDSINKDRELYIETLHEERMHFSREIRTREADFQNLVSIFRNTAAAKEDKLDKKWWKFWKKPIKTINN